MGIVELKVSSVVDSQKDLYLFKSKKAANQKLEKMLRELYGPYNDFQGIAPRQNLLLKTIGKEAHNNLVRKLYSQGYPKKKDVCLKFSNKSCVIVENLYPVKLINNDFSCDLKKDPDLRCILWGYMNKHSP